jgi:hypothetical protein
MSVLFSVVVPEEGPSLVRRYAQYMTCFNISYDIWEVLVVVVGW